VKRALLVAAAFLAMGNPSDATIAVIDYTSILNNITAEAKNYLQYVTEVENSYQQIENQYTQIIGMYDQLRRFGDPAYYINLLNLNSFTSSASSLSGGIGHTVSQIEQTANGVAALGYTANGIYSNLQGMVDRFGRPVQFNQDAFRKFSTVQYGADAYDQQLRTYNTQIASLEQQLTYATNQMNADSSAEGRARYQALMEGIHAQIDALNGQTQAAAHRVLIQQAMNQNDAARTAEAERQKEAQERKADLEGEANGLSGLIWGGAD
jgi:hypothetical protein